MFHRPIYLYIFSFSPIPPRSTQDNAIIDASKLACDRAWCGVFGDQAAGRVIYSTLLPLVGISWSKKIIVAVDTRPAGRPAACVGEELPTHRLGYDRVADLFALAKFAPGDLLSEWEEWRAIADRYRLGRRYSWSILDGAVTQMLSLGVRSPSYWLNWNLRP